MKTDEEFNPEDLCRQLDFLEDYLNESIEVLLHEYEIYKCI